MQNEATPFIQPKALKFDIFHFAFDVLKQKFTSLAE